MTNKEASTVWRVYIALGTNLGDREANLRQARASIEALGLRITRASSIYETEPVGYSDQPWFFNQVIEAEFEDDRATEPYKSALGLLDSLLRVEDRMGRERGIANGPRLIDLDLLMFGDLTISVIESLRPGASSKNGMAISLDLPHPRMHLRRFVLEPMCEIAPLVFHPVERKTVAELLSRLKDESVVRRVKSLAG
ncbi:MAG TPA: 2-amino-4-hydroxy-6-hydroxymethyldihydropteridine diphosphokinase [Blastocatellia bacterium]|nr:2-amino-4-hydroxy-6-hydroxymethyldihydropteridine diphosphokinase [Blastocatellia bacterium]